MFIALVSHETFIVSVGHVRYVGLGCLHYGTLVAFII